MMIRSTTSSDTKRYNAGQRAEKIFVSDLFARLASAPRNERGIGDLSMIPKRMDSWGKPALHPFHSLIPQVLLFEFFFLNALEHQITESKNDQHDMPSPASPASALIVIQTQLLLQLLVALLDPEPFVKKTHHLQSRHVLRHITEKVPEFIFAIVLLSFLDNQPDWGMLGRERNPLWKVRGVRRMFACDAQAGMPLSWKHPSDLSAVLRSGTGRDEHMEMGVEPQKSFHSISLKSC